MNTKSWLWPDHVIGKRESRELREAHNKLVNSHAAAVAALEAASAVLLLAANGQISERELEKAEAQARAALASAKE